MYKTVQTYMDTLHATWRESNFTATMLKDIPTFDGKDFKAGRLVHGYRDHHFNPNRYHTCLAEVKSHGLAHTLMHEASKTGKCWDEIKGKYPHLYLKIYGDTTKKKIKVLLPTSITSNQQQRDVLLIKTLWQSAFLLKALGMQPLSHPKYMRTPKFWLRSSDMLRSSAQPTN